jgi:tetratricopeptide (TPR) repeat protein
VVVLLVGGIVALTWVKNVNNLRALNQVAGLNQAFINGNLNDSVMMLNRAIELAPNVYHYHTNLGAVYSAYQSATVQEPDCNLLTADVASYEICLARKVSESYAAEVAHSSWRWRSRLDLAEAELDLFRLTQDGDRAAESVRLYRETAAMVPYSWKLRNQLAQMLTALGDPEESLLEIEKSLAITGSSPNSADAMLLRGPAYNNLGNTYVDAGQYQQAVESYDEAIRLNPEYALAYNNRGGAYVQLGRYEAAIADYGVATRINPLYANAYFNRALAYAMANRFAEARQDLTKAAELGADGAKLENLIDQLEAGTGIVQPVWP